MHLEHITLYILKNHRNFGIYLLIRLSLALLFAQTVAFIVFHFSSAYSIPFFFMPLIGKHQYILTGLHCQVQILQCVLGGLQDLTGQKLEQLDLNSVLNS